jgi:hypothetical protein
MCALVGLILSPISMTAEPVNDKIKDLRPLQWEYRILLLFPGGTDPKPLLTELQKGEAGILERDIAWFVFRKDGVATNCQKPLAEQFAASIRERTSSGSDDLEVVLIGKDGGVKARYTELDLPSVFARIDSMPMRQAEMRRRQ